MTMVVARRSVAFTCVLLSCILSLCTSETETNAQFRTSTTHTIGRSRHGRHGATGKAAKQKNAKAWKSEGAAAAQRGRRHRGLQDAPLLLPSDNALIDPKSCKGGKGRTCSPSASPSVSPSAAPTISHMPSQSVSPSAAPSISTAPSAYPSPAPTQTPSISPSDMPTSLPSVAPTQTPSVAPSDMPTSLPSVQPSPGPTVSRPPSASPSVAPTARPTTAAPTISAAPSVSTKPTGAPVIDPNGFVERIVSDPNNGDTGVESRCRPSVPDDATSVTNQAVVFDYTLNLVPGTDVFLAIDYIATQLQRDLSTEYLVCLFEPGQEDFYTAALSSLPVDTLDATKGCSTDEIAPDADCYRVDAAFTAEIFYLPQQAQAPNATRARELQTTTANTTIADPNVYESFSASLQALLDSGDLSAGMPGILGTSYNGITNNDSGGDGDGGGGSVPIEGGGGGSSTDKSLSSGAVAGSVIGALLGAALLVVLLALAVRAIRRRRRRQGKRAKAVDVTHADYFHDSYHHAGYSYDVSDERDDQAMLRADRALFDDNDNGAMCCANPSFAGSDDEGSFLSGHPEETFEVAVVVDHDDQSFESGLPMTDNFSFRPHSRSVGPSFVKTNEIIDELKTAEMRSRIEAEFGPPAAAASPPRGKRGYGMPDTVQL